MDRVANVTSGAREVVEFVANLGNATASVDDNMPRWLVKGATLLRGKALGVLSQLHGTLQAAVTSPEHCLVPRNGSALWQHMQGMWAQLRAWYEGITASFEQAEARVAQDAALSCAPEPLRAMHRLCGRQARLC